MGIFQVNSSVASHGLNLWSLKTTTYKCHETTNFTPGCGQSTVVGHVKNSWPKLDVRDFQNMGHAACMPPANHFDNCRYVAHHLLHKTHHIAEPSMPLRLGCLKLFSHYFCFGGAPRVVAIIGRLSINSAWFLCRTTFKEYETEREQINGSQLALIENVNLGNSVFDDLHSMHNNLWHSTKWWSLQMKYFIFQNMSWQRIYDHSHCEENLFHEPTWYSTY